MSEHVLIYCSWGQGTQKKKFQHSTHSGNSVRSKITDFVGQRSILLFSLLKMDHKFLLQENWKETDKYDAARKAISNLHPVNDSAERALSMATTFNGRITKDEDSYQNLLRGIARSMVSKAKQI